MDENAVEIKLNSREIKPPFSLLKSSPSLFQSHSFNKRLPGKLKGESRLNQFANLIEDQEVKSYHAPKPPKKRYLEENYSQNKGLNPILENVNINVSQLNKITEITIAESKKEGINENALYPDVNPIILDVDPKTESKEVESRIEKLSWRKKLLCWEKLEEVDTPKCFLRLNPIQIPSSDELNNFNGNNSSARKSSVLANDHYEDKNIDNSSKLGRRGRARACKGQKYREFMWTNVIHQRRKSSRWELCQDIVEGSDLYKQDTSKSSHIKAELTISKLERRNIKINSDVNSIDSFYKKRKVPNKKTTVTAENKIEINKRKRGISESPKKKLIKKESDERIHKSSDTSPRKMSPIVGSKKRKLRRKSIRRLEPGSNFKDTRVVEDSGLETLASVAASKMKLRSNTSN